MEREIDLNEISDGRLYSANDLVKVGCRDCLGCSACCKGMGHSIILDPYDLFCLESLFKVKFEELMKERIELNVVDGIIQPNLQMTGKQECCSFLNQEGRCSIHGSRPGFCRLFPLGRIYEEESFQYFLQIHECKAPNKTKVKVKKWMDIPRFAQYEVFICDWHYFLKGMQKILWEAQHEELERKVNLYVLSQFYVKPYQTEVDFYDQFYERLKEAKEIWDFRS